MKKNVWYFDVLIVIVLSFLMNYAVVAMSNNEIGIIMGQFINVFGVFIWLMFGIFRITGFKKSNQELLISFFKKRCILRCFLVAILVFIVSRLSYSFLVEIEFVKKFELLSNTLLKPGRLSPESFLKNDTTLIILGSIFVSVGVFAEELFFRLYLFNLQYVLYGKYTWIINGISWSIIHVFAKANVIALLPTAFLISWTYQQTRNFWIVFLAHLLLNGVSLYGIIIGYRA